MIRIAVLGAGRIGQVHATSVASNARAKLVAVVDAVPAAAAKLAQKHGCEAAGDPLAIIARADVDAVVIGTPTDTHVDLVLAAAKAGKAVLCEKPIDLDIGRATVALQQVEKVGARVMMGFNRRFDPSAAAMKRAIDAGDVGALEQVIITSRDPGLAPYEYIAHSGGIFRDMTIHDFDMARWLLGEEPVEIVATASRMVDPNLSKYDDFDTVMVLMRTKSGRQCHINCSRRAVYGYDQRMEAFGSAGMVQNDNLRPTTLRRFSQSTTEAREPLLNFFLERYMDSYRAELDAFLDALERSAAMPVTVRDGCQALRLADCANESVRTGRVVSIS